ncbi:NADH-quinone oxidoreductase subunit I [Oligoflexia bacterium]|nr:NADH-quinone oxidoreductase subunit I [Oligoflexia bacterium]
MAQALHPFVQYFSDIWLGITSTLKGMRLTLRYFFKPKATVQYPEVRIPIPDGFCGIHTFDEERCTACGACVTACPVDTITIDAVGKAKNAMILQYDIDYMKCLFCNLCVEACPTHCLVMSKEYDLATLDKETCIMRFARLKSVDEVADHEKLLEQKKAEKKAKAEAAKQKVAASSENDTE